MTEDQHIELLSPEVGEIVSRPPRWMTRWGLVLLSAVILLLIAGCWFIQYPDMISSAVVVTTENPPVGLMARSDGKITELMVKDNDSVSAGQTLALLENPALFKDMEFLMQCLADKKLEADTNRLFRTLKERQSLALGSVQPAFEEYLKAGEEYLQFAWLQYHQKKIVTLEREATLTQKYYQRLANQNEIMEKDYLLGDKQFSRDSALFREKVISSNDIEKSESSRLQKKYSLEGVRVSLAGTQITLAKLNQQILELRLQYQQEKQRLLLALEQSKNKLANSINDWQLSFVLKSPVDGIVSFNRFWSVNQNVKSGDKVLSVIVAGSREPVAKLSLPLNGAGKVRPGQVVNIKLADFPYLEYGLVKGRVRTISLTPNDDHYLVEVELPDGTRTNYGYTVRFNQEMQGTADIVTEKISLLKRFINPLKYFFRKND